MLLSIIICTFNRKDDVQLVIKELFRQFKELYLEDSEPKLVIAGIELLIIDNNSTDNTGNMVFNMIAQKENGNMEFRYIIEMDQGSSQARNRGIKEAQGNLLAFLDDDIQLDKDWLKTVFAISRNKPQKLVYGARVIPQWSGGEENLPEWLNLDPPYEIIESSFPAHDYGSKAKAYPFELKPLNDELNEEKSNDVLDEEIEAFSFINKIKNFSKRKVQNPISACFLASKDLFNEHGNFNPDLGIKAKQRGACEDTELFWRFLAAGIKIIYMPSITVYHPVPPKRMTKKFILDWYELLGKTLYFMQINKLCHLSPDREPASKLKLRLKFALFIFLYITSFIFIDPVKSFWYRCQIAKTKGELVIASSLRS